MAFQAGFDLEAFCAAIERGDIPAQLRCYADDAEVSLQSLGDSSQTTRTLQGGRQIQEWMTTRCADRDGTLHVVCQWIEADQIMVTEECDHHDGSLVLTASTAHVHRNCITHQSTVVVETSRPPKAA